LTSGSAPVATPVSGQVGTAKLSISRISPTSGPAGTSVAITGQSFTGAASVSFSRVEAASFTVISPTEITATVPYGAQTGSISVNTPTGTATSGNFEVIATIGLRLEEYKRFANQTTLLGAGLLGGLALFNALHALKPIPEAILATLFVTIVLLVAWARGSIDYQQDLIGARKQEKQLDDSMTMQAATKLDSRIQQDLRLPFNLYIMAAILALVAAFILIGLEWYSALQAPQSIPAKPTPTGTEAKPPPAARETNPTPNAEVSGKGGVNGAASGSVKAGPAPPFDLVAFFSQELAKSGLSAEAQAKLASQMARDFCKEVSAKSPSGKCEPLFK
jgi:IPT/TIG domain